MNSCHEEGVRDRNRSGIEAAEPARDRQLRFQLDSGREQPPHDMNLRENGTTQNGYPNDKIAYQACWPCMGPKWDAKTPNLSIVQFLMNSCHEEGVRDRTRAGIEAADPASSGSAL
eukprot:gene15260-biopygen4217